MTTPAHFPALVAMSTPLAQARHGHPFGASAETIRVAVADCARLLGASDAAQAQADAAKEVSRRLHGPARDTAHSSYLAYRAVVVAYEQASARRRRDPVAAAQALVQELEAEGPSPALDRAREQLCKLLT